MPYNLDEFDKHSIYLERLASGGVKTTILPSLGAVYKAIREKLGKYDDIPNRAILKRIEREIREAIEQNNGWAKFTKEHLEQILEYESQWQAAFAAASTGLAVKAPAQAKVLDYVNKSIMNLDSQAGLWPDFVKANKDSHAKQINNIVNRGYARGEAIASITKDIRALSEGKIKREAEALARTGYIHYAAQANEAMIMANSDILEEYFYSVTWDNRTTLICQGVTKYNEIGSRFKVGDAKAPTPPLHYNCRTRRLAIPKGEGMEGARAAIGGKEGKSEEYQERKDRKRTSGKVRYKGRKDLDIFDAGQVNASKSTAAWFKEQPLWWLESNMGKTRARLVKSGGLSIHKLTDANLKPLTLDELKQLHPTNFKKAGL